MSDYMLRYEFARLRVAQDRLAEAVELLVLLLQQTASQQARLGQGRIRDNAEELLSGLRAHISQEACAAAMEHGVSPSNGS